MNSLTRVIANILLLSSSLLLPADSALVVAPDTRVSTAPLLPQEPLTERTSCWSRCFTRPSAPSLQPHHESEESKQRSRECCKFVSAYTGCIMGFVLLYKLVSLTDSPTHTPTVFFEMNIKPACNDACSTAITMRGLCVPDHKTAHALLKEVAHLCRNSSSIGLRPYEIDSSTPLVPCQSINTTLSELATNCPSNTTHTHGLSTQVAPVNPVRQRLHTKLRRMAEQRKAQ